MAHRTLNPRTENYAEYPSVTHPEKFGNLLPQVNFQISLQVDPGTFALLDHGLKP